MTTEPGNSPKPSFYHKEGAKAIFDYIKAGESCAIVGIGSVGKSNLLRHIQQHETKRQAEHLGGEALNYVIVYLNPHKMIHLHGDAIDRVGASWSGYEIMLSRLRRTLWEMDDRFNLFPVTGEDEKEKSLVDTVEAYYNNMFSPQVTISQSGIRHLEDAVYKVLRQSDKLRIIFLFDEVEEFLRRLPAPYFQTLRGLRDEFKRRVMYITASRHTPLENVKNLAATKSENYRATYLAMMEGFIELFHEATHYIQPLDRESAHFVIQDMLVKNQVDVDPASASILKEAAFKITGGHAGLLRRCFWPLREIIHRLEDPFGEDYPTSTLLEQICLFEDDGVRRECDIIYHSLTAPEQMALKQIGAGQQVNSNSVLTTLKKKYLIEAPTWHIISPLLNQYVKTLLSPSEPPP